MNQPVKADEQGHLRGRVLIVDDSQDNALMLKMLVKLHGYESRIAYDGPEALAAAAAFRPDVIFMDLTLPGMSGQAVAEELRRSEDFSQTVILALSGHAADQIPQPSPFDDYLIKPVDHDRLTQILAIGARGEVKTRERAAMPPKKAFA